MEKMKEQSEREGGNGGRENKALRVNGEDKKMVNLKNYGVHTDKRQTSFFFARSVVMNDLYYVYVVCFETSIKCEKINQSSICISCIFFIF